MTESGGTAGAGPLVLDRVEVGDASLEAIVRVVDSRLMRTVAVAGINRAALAALPGLKRHRCECGSAHGIEQELADTESPHLLEHVVLELMALSGSPRTLRGETAWDFAVDGTGTFRVRIDFDDDLVALGALERGLRLVNALLRAEDPPRSAQLVQELRGLRHS